MIEDEQFVDILYVGQHVISNEHFTVIEDTGITEEFICNNNSDKKGLDNLRFVYKSCNFLASMGSRIKPITYTCQAQRRL